ncbi:hypothetical protein TcCL_ESM07783 [Trypanosoma cruzi]|uniref:Uncharacterized protein n=1 Tax=Trypanosoma cruzi (strain CL Brener) TaxID=353153 RepID=Q4DWJ8_TRYCC|nr:hypothetical protein, conserved [Trypanosoma cruzi]EAN96907.1 hypothetical protein, conserved [Trypanosoma cruzi]RNC54764.1 hypothetical protein TcCL_ESM07783 [Trypanosoma cruzi]|eukprot:XP_818758.1 hypothetical protein [Trypanosoma cruzi strain CL Brener]
MPLEGQEGTTRRFLQHFFSILDAREQQSASLARGGREELSSLLQLRQRTAIGNLFPEWVRLLLTQPPGQSKGSVHVDKGRRGGGASAGTTSYYLDSNMAERWFAFPHLALLSSVWATQRVPPPLRATRHRLLHHLQQRYERSTNEREKCGVFADDFMRSLSQHSNSDGRSVEYSSFMNAVQSLFPHHQSSQCHQHPPVALVAAALFSEWCAVAEGGDASFASTRVLLKVIADDIAAYSATINGPAREPDEGVNTLVVVGTLAGLACAYPMTTATRAGLDKGFSVQQGRKRKRVGDSDDEYDDDDEEEEEEEEEDEEEEYGSDDNVDGDYGADDEELNKSSTKTDGYGDLWRSQRRQLNSYIRRNTTAFRVPLASVLLNIFHVRHDGTGDAMMECHVTPAHPSEVHCRRGELRWFIVGESKRHRNMLESK